MKVLHLLAAGGVGGIETLCKDFSGHSSHENIFLFVWYGGAIADEMKAEGRHVIDLRASKRDFFGPLKTIVDFCKKEKPAVIIVHHASPVMYLYVDIIKRIIPPIKVFIYAHSDAADMIRVGEKRHLLIRKLIMYTSIKLADGVIAISQSVETSLIKYFKLKKERIHVIYNGVNTKKFEMGFRDVCDVVRLIYVGRLIKEKGVQNTLRVLAMLPAEAEFLLQIVGDGVYRKELEQQAMALGVASKVRFLGTRRDVPELLKKSDVFIHLPEWEEGFGITVIEAMASGVVPICAYSGALPEIIEPGINGFLVDRRDYEGLAEMLKKLMASMHSESISEMQRQVVIRADFFSIEKYAEKLDNLISGARGN